MLPLDDCGRGSTLHSGHGDPWDFVTTSTVERDVLNVLLPDDAEESGETHEWDRFVQTLEPLVTPTVVKLMALPYEVVLSPRLRRRLVAHEGDG